MTDLERMMLTALIHIESELLDVDMEVPSYVVKAINSAGGRPALLSKREVTP